MIVVVAPRSIGIGAREILSISLPRTNTLVGSDSEVLLPSKTLALLKRVTAASTCWPCAILAEKVSAEARIAGAKYPMCRIKPSLSRRRERGHRCNGRSRRLNGLNSIIEHWPKTVAGMTASCTKADVRRQSSDVHY